MNCYRCCIGLVVEKGSDGKETITFDTYSRLEEAFLKKVCVDHKNVNTYLASLMKEPLRLIL